MGLINTPLELWGGFECTVARIGDQFRDQVRETGHYWRMSDLDAVAGLGIRTLRYPVLWETVSPHTPDDQDWSWHDARLAHLRHLGIAPIVGLLHHGSGPAYTDLLDPLLPARLADHASRVADRYPWVTRFTPVNEPLTTARFSGLYGHWYPHLRSESAVMRMVVAQCKATVLAMRAIRKTTPGAELVQTEDIGKTFSTPGLAGQADYENERRWLSLDLLSGRIAPSHPWHRRLIDMGVAENDLALLRDGEGLPDLIGVNHYLTSERYLDGRLRAYPKALRGGNGRQRYADAEAVRVPACADATGSAARLTETWARYDRPLAVTEVHHGCSRDEQLRWLAEVWDAADAVRASGVPVVAVTLWSLMGAVDWNSLLVTRAGTYEPGAFDIRASVPRETALAKAARALATTGGFAHPVLDGPGWWRRPSRFYEPPRTGPATKVDPARPILILGANGSLGGALARICTDRGLHRTCSPTDGADVGVLAGLIAAQRAWAVIDTTALDLDAAVRRYPGATLVADVGRARRVAAACARVGVPLLAFSGDRVFDGRLGRSASEADTPRPEGLYGVSANAAEVLIRSVHPGALVVRTGLVFDAPDRDARRDRVLNALRSALRLPTPQSETLSLSYLPDLAHAALDLLIDGETAFWHLVNGGAIARDDILAEVAGLIGMPEPPAVHPGPPLLDRSLTSHRGLIMPTRASALQRFADAVRTAWSPQARQAAE